jgi:ribonuclease HI
VSEAAQSTVETQTAKIKEVET